MSTTSVFAVKYKDGILLAADASVSTHFRQPFVTRYHKIKNHMLITASGSHADLQETVFTLQKLKRNDANYRDGYSYDAPAYHAYLTRVCYGLRNKMNPLLCNFVIAGQKADKTFYLGQTNPYGGEKRDVEYIATSWGNFLGLDILRRESDPNMSYKDAKALLIEVLKINADNDLAMSRFIQFANLTKTGIEIQQPFSLEHFRIPEDYLKSVFNEPICGFNY